MERHLRIRRPLSVLLPALAAASLSGAAGARAPLAPLAPPTATPAPAVQGPVVGTLRTTVPAAPRFVLHGTLPVAPRPFDRFACPFRVVDPDGRALDTQWSLVARLQDVMVVELRALVDNEWQSEQTFQVVEAPNPLHLLDFDYTALAMLILRDTVRVEVRDQNGGIHFRSLTGYDPAHPPFRLGPATVTIERTFDDALGGGQCWVTLDAASKQLEIVYNWNNGTLPARPDLYFRSVRVRTIPGWTWTSFLPDPAAGNGYLVKPDDHVIPQRMERSFRIVVHPNGTTPELERPGWAVADWSQGGYMPQSIALPDMGHATIDLASQRLEDYDLLRNNQPKPPGGVPVSFLWPAYGVRYGGMTGGIDIHQYEGVSLATTGQTDGLLSFYVEQLRYTSRQMGCIYEANGEPLVVEDYADPDGTLPWTMFNNVFQGNPPDDEPFGFSQTGSGNGTAAYDPLVFDPIDDQHLIRRTKANKVLAWLDNDPLARLYLSMDASLRRMIFYDGPGGRCVPPAVEGQGLHWGRAEAWAADVMATTYAIEDDAWRARNLNWFVQFTTALDQGQMSNGLFSALDDSKVATSTPYGHQLDEPCPFGIHQLQAAPTAVADFFAHRGNEQVFLMLALRSVQKTVGFPTGGMIATAGQGLWELAWKVGTPGLLDRYPAGPIDGPRYTMRSQVPAGLTTTIPPDHYHVGTAIYHALVEGGAMLPALYAYTGTGNLQDALAVLQARGHDNLFNYAPLLGLLQQVLP